MESFIAETTFSSILILALFVMIFLLTFVLAVKRLFGFLITLVLICCALISGYVILNHQIVRDFINKEYPAKQTEQPNQPQEPAVTEEPKEVEKDQTEKFKEEIKEVYESVKTEVETLLQKVKDFLQKTENKNSNVP